MREDNLLCIRRRSFTLTTDSNHTLAVYPNLARQIEPTGIDQLWIADMTYIRLRSEFVYLAIVLDAFSRRVIGWALGRTLEAQLTCAALNMARFARPLLFLVEQGLTDSAARVRALLRFTYVQCEGRVGAIRE